MLDALRFVSGAVSKLDTVPALTHYRVEDGFVMGFNGTVALCSPIPLDITASPHAEQFYRALKCCDDVVTITQQANGTIRVKSGKFSANVDCTPEPYPAVAPDGPAYTVKPGMLAVLKKLLPLIGNDPLKLWMNGALFAQDSTVTVTDGVLLAQYWLGDYVHMNCNVPAAAIKEVVRTGVDPIALQYGNNSLTFHFPDGRWLRTTLFNAAWPIPTVQALLAGDAAYTPITEDFFPGVEKLLGFGDDFTRIEAYHARDGEFCGFQVTDATGTVRAKIDSDLWGAGVYNGKLLMRLRGLASHIAFSRYPKPVQWYGENVRGVIMGMREREV